VGRQVHPAQHSSRAQQNSTEHTCQRDTSSDKVTCYSQPCPVLFIVWSASPAAAASLSSVCVLRTHQPDLWRLLCCGPVFL
jgi:hypothetical protein